METLLLNHLHKVKDYDTIKEERDIAVQQLKELGYELGENIGILSYKQQVEELQDVVASLQCRIDGIYDDIRDILIEGEPTEVGRIITIERLKDYFLKEYI